MKKKKKQKEKVSSFKEYKQFFTNKDSKKDNYVNSIPAEIRSTSIYKEYQKLNSKKENIAFFINWSTIVSICAFLYCLVTELVKNTQFIVHVVVGCICIATAIISALLALYKYKLNTSKKSKEIIEKYNSLLDVKGD